MGKRKGRLELKNKVCYFNEDKAERQENSGYQYTGSQHYLSIKE